MALFGMVLGAGLVPARAVASLGSIELVSLNSSGQVANSYDSRALDISVGGRYVLFSSSASNLVDADSNGATDIFVRDRVLGTTTRVAENAVEGQMSDDGRFVVVKGAYPASQVRLIDRQTGVQTIVTTTLDSPFALSGDGSTVAFSTRSSLVSTDRNGGEDIYLYDRVTGSLQLPVLSTQASYYAGGSPFALDSDGSVLGFISGDPIVAGDGCCTFDAFAYDKTSGVSVRVSAPPPGLYGGGSSGPITLSGDGRFVAFVGGPLVSGAPFYALYTFDRATGAQALISGLVTGPLTMSGDGRYLGFRDALSGLLMIHDTSTHVSEVVNDGGFNSGGLAIAPDASYVAFSSMGQFTAGVSGYQVYVRQLGDVTPPVVTVPPDLTVEAVSADGANATFAVTATDDGAAAPSVVCVPASGSMFPLGDTTVTCTATDGAGNHSSGSFAVHVVDTTAPVLTAPPSAGSEATGPDGSVVSYSVTAIDTVDPNPSVSCVPTSGATFPIGDTTVNCTATDASHNTATASFTVHVKGAEEQVSDLSAQVDDFLLVKLGTSLHDKLAVVQEMLRSNHPTQACENLNSFLNEVKAQTGKALIADQARTLTVAGQRIRNVIAC